MTTARAIVVAAAILAVLPLSARLAGQTSNLPMRPYGQLAGCSEKPAEFHACALEKAKTFDPPRTEEGVPDFTGYWSRARVSTDNIEEHPQSFENPGGVSFVIDPADGKIPYQSWALAIRDKNPSIFHDTQSVCFVPGPPRQAYAPGGYQILQVPGAIVFIQDFAHAYRVIPTDRRTPVFSNSIRTAMGESLGRWEGSTLVVDVRNMRAQSWFDHAGNFFSDAATLVERWTMIAPDALHYEATITDPNVYTRPWTIAFGIRRNSTPGYQILEVACHEGSRSGLTDVGLKRYPYRGVTVPDARGVR